MGVIGVPAMRPWMTVANSIRLTETIEREAKGINKWKAEWGDEYPVYPSSLNREDGQDSCPPPLPPSRTSSRATESRASAMRPSSTMSHQDEKKAQLITMKKKLMEALADVEQQEAALNAREAKRKGK